MSGHSAVTDWKFNVGDGWHPILEELHAELEKLIPGYRAEQVKEKFGTLRVYVSPWSDAVYEAIRRSEEESSRTCEQCGAPGEIRTSRFWLKTLCGRCEGRRSA